ncbi:hypothetical protein X733_29460 [Mesorhizobium sp. L2C067A000]|nr:hypothetical protein X733_29460 [Mesorhizobium sp. L2C067A000]
MVCSLLFFLDPLDHCVLNIVEILGGLRRLVRLASLRSTTSKIHFAINFRDIQAIEQLGSGAEIVICLQQRLSQFI